MLISMKKLLLHAQKNRFAVGYFEAFNMDCMEAVLNAAEKTDSPVIIGFGGQFIGSPKRNYKEDIYLYGKLAKEAAKRSKVPVAVILNEANEEEMIYQGMNAGFNTVMYQKEGEAFEDTVRITKEICRAAHFMGIDVERSWGAFLRGYLNRNAVAGPRYGCGAGQIFCGGNGNRRACRGDRQYTPA